MKLAIMYITILLTGEPIYEATVPMKDKAVCTHMATVIHEEMAARYGYDPRFNRYSSPYGSMAIVVACGDAEGQEVHREKKGEDNT